MHDLHNVPSELRMAWYGEFYPCNDPYHISYDLERTNTTDHSGCAIRFLGFQEDEHAEGIRCNCDCNIQAATHVVIYSPWDGFSRTCPDCTESRHPQPPTTGYEVH